MTSVSHGQSSSTLQSMLPVMVALVIILLFYMHDYQLDTIGQTGSYLGPKLHRPPKFKKRTHELRNPHGSEDGALDCHILHKSNSCTTLPNYFMYPSYRRYHRDAIINFMHIPKCGGTTMKECMLLLALKLQMARPFLLHTEGRLKVTEDILNEDYSVLDNTSLFMGDYSFGFCDLIHDKIGDRKCSTFIILREPYDRMVSNYFFCRQINQSIPGIPNCLTTPITEWSLLTRSILWNEFFTDIKCTRADRWKCVIDYAPIVKEAYVLSKNTSFMDSVVASLDKHFSLIGLTEDLPTTFRMLQTVYNLPFFDYCEDKDYNVGDYSSPARANRTRTREEARRVLLGEEEIKRTLYPEIQIYNRAKEIFEIEKRELEKL